VGCNVLTKKLSPTPSFSISYQFFLSCFFLLPQAKLFPSLQFEFFPVQPSLAGFFLLLALFIPIAANAIEPAVLDGPSPRFKCSPT